MTYWKGQFSDTNLKSETFADILTGCSSRCRDEKVSNFKLVSENLTAEAMCGTKFSHVLSLADITIEFAMPSYTVSESVGDAMLTVTAQGDFPSAALQSQLTVPVEAVVLAYTDDITAEGLILHLYRIAKLNHIILVKNHIENRSRTDTGACI